MRFGINIPPFADFSDPRVLAELAHEAEVAGWDGFFIWDAMFFDPTFHPIGPAPHHSMQFIQVSRMGMTQRKPPTSLRLMPMQA